MNAKPNAKFMALVAAAALHGAASAQLQPPPEGVVNLAASASTEVPQDVMRLTFTTTSDGRDANAVQTTLKKALDAALAQARAAARPGELEVQTGNFSLHPRYDKTVITGWQGTAELIVEGRDMAAIGQLAGRISSMTIGRIDYSLSREQRQAIEGEVAAQAIARFRAKAADYATRFGYSGYSIREVSVNTNEGGGPVPLRMKAASASYAAEAALPVEAGKATVTVSVNGNVQMK